MDIEGIRRTSDTQRAEEQLRPAVLRIQALGFWCTAEREREQVRQE